MNFVIHFKSSLTMPTLKTKENKICPHIFDIFWLQVNYWDSMDCSLPGFSVHEILQARILAWVATPFSR